MVYVIFIIATPNEVGNNRIVGSVCQFICPCVFHFFQGIVRPREHVFGIFAGHMSGGSLSILGSVSPF